MKQYNVVLLGLSPDTGRLKSLLVRDAHVRRLFDCGENMECAVKTINTGLSTIFFVGVPFLSSCFSPFVDQLELAWRRGVIVGEHNNWLGIEAINSDCFADYIPAMADGDRLQQTFAHLWNWETACSGIALVDSGEKEACILTIRTKM